MQELAKETMPVMENVEAKEKARYDFIVLHHKRMEEENAIREYALKKKQQEKEKQEKEARSSTSTEDEIIQRPNEEKQTIEKKNNS